MDNNLNLFYQYSTSNFFTVWSIYQNVLNNKACISLSETRLYNEKFIYFGQPKWGSRIEEFNDKEKEELITLLESDRVYIKTPPLIHPAFTEKIAEILNFSQTELLSLANYDSSFIDNKFVKRNPFEIPINSGPYFIKKLLEAKESLLTINNETIDVSQLLITRVPLFPLKKRVFLKDVFDYSVPGVDNVNYQLILLISSRLLEDQEHEDSFFANSYKFLQQCFEELIVAVQYNFQNNRWDTLKKIKELRKIKSIEENDKKIKKIEKPSQESLFLPLYREYWLTQSNTIPVDTMIIDESRLCVQFQDRIIFYDFLNHKEEEIVVVPCYQLEQVSLGKNVIQFYGCQNVDKHQINDFIQYNFLTRQWFTGELEGLSYIELSHEIESQKLVDYKCNIDIFLHELSDYPTKKIRSVCGKYMWINDKFGIGGLYDLNSGLCVVYADDTDELLDSEIPLYKFKEFSDLIENDQELKKILSIQQKNSRFDLGALVIIDQEWIMLYDHVVYVNKKEVFEIDFMYTSATFSFDASKLFLINQKSLLILEVRDIINNNNKYRLVEFSK